MTAKFQSLLIALVALWWLAVCLAPLRAILATAAHFRAVP